jgi:hypothetical protein
MASVNRVVDPASMQKTMTAYATQMEKIGMQEEMWGDMMDEFDGDEVEAEADNVYNQVCHSI